jgi:hypothetical protein
MPSWRCENWGTAFNFVHCLQRSLYAMLSYADKDKLRGAKGLTWLATGLSPDCEHYH